MLNLKLLGKFDKWCKLSSLVEEKWHKKQSYETGPACNVKLNKFLQLRHKNYHAVNITFSLIFHTGRLKVLGKFILMLFK
jgi:hypothetical protein